MNVWTFYLIYVMEMKKLRISNQMMDTIITKFKAMFYKPNATKASEIIKDKKKAKKLLEEAMQKAKENRSGPVDEMWSTLQLVFSLVRDWIKGDYKNIPKGSLIIIIIGLIYFITPLDMIPDLIPGGFVDDVVILGFLLKQIGSDIDNYKIWKDDKPDIDSNAPEEAVVDVEEYTVSDLPDEQDIKDS